MGRSRTRLAALIAVLGMAFMAVTVVRGQETPSRAAVVVVLPEGDVSARCVAFDEPSISGFELLRRSGLPFEVDAAGMGPAVCAIAGTGCPADDCFCECTGGDCLYWSYWHQTDGVWRYSAAGAGSYQVSDGAVDGWVWGPGAPGAAPTPAPIAFDAICSADSASAVDAAMPGPPGAAPPGAAPAAGPPLAYGAFGLLLLLLLGAALLNRRRSARP